MWIQSTIQMAEQKKLQIFSRIMSKRWSKLLSKTNDEKYLTQFVDIMKSWINNNPYLQGINWYSNLEINIRLINLY